MSDAATQYETLLIEKKGAVDWVTMNRPEALNSLNTTLVDELLDYFGNLYFDRSTRIVVLRGAGRAFCAGLDLKQSGARRNSEGANVRGPDAGLLGLEVGECLMVSSNSFDVMGGRACGFRGAYVNRYRLPYEDTPYRADVTVADFATLAAALLVAARQMSRASSPACLSARVSMGRR